jgi:hypothetical protein
MPCALVAIASDMVNDVLYSFLLCFDGCRMMPSQNLLPEIAVRQGRIKRIFNLYRAQIVLRTMQS